MGRIMAERVNDQPVNTIAIAATFTAELLEESLNFWGRELQKQYKVAFAPYNQVFQQILDPSSLFSNNTNGINVILIRFEDWLRYDNSIYATKQEKGAGLTEQKVLTENAQEKIRENVNNLLLPMKNSLERSSTPYLLCICPPSPAVVADKIQNQFYQQMENYIFSELEDVHDVYFLTNSEFTSKYPVPLYYDAYSNEIGHIPYTPAFFTALGTMIVRKFEAIRRQSYKVITLDCDQTLWKGVCGEDGASGVEIDEPRKKLQEFIIQQHAAGMLICLCSKNSEEDVVEVFNRNPGMLLKRDHVLSWKVNWEPKSKNIITLSKELKLGLDSFIFLDDNPVECAEVRANCPDVLTFCLPENADTIPEFLEHIWAFDHLKITEEDKERTDLYKQNIKRETLLKDSLTLEDFLKGLNLEIHISPPEVSHLTRVAQLTQRTNQFNCTTIRRSEGEIENLLRSKQLECLIIEVSDRFGDYGLVGVILFKAGTDAIIVDTLLLSCRVLGRGVEYRMLSKLGEIAKERGLDYIEVPYISTKKNLPVFNFLEITGAKYKKQVDNGYIYKFPSEIAIKLSYKPSHEQPADSDVRQENHVSLVKTYEKQVSPSQTESELWQNIAINFCNADKILEIIESRNLRQRPEISSEYLAPQTEIERKLGLIWQEVLHIDGIGILDDFLELGGNSLQATQIISRINHDLKVGIEIRSFFESPTIKGIARLIQKFMESNIEQTISPIITLSRTSRRTKVS